MQFIKMFGLAAVVSVAALAFLGASSAMAGDTAVCKSNEGGAPSCANSNLATELHGVSTSPPVLLLENAFLHVDCQSSLTKVTTLGLTNPLIVHLEELTWINCKASIISCTLTNMLLGLGTALKTTENLATVSLPELAVRVVCGEKVRCTYSIAPGATLHAEGANGPSNGHLTANKVAMTPTINHQPFGTICPNATWDALYTNLTPVYIKT